MQNGYKNLKIPEQVEDKKPHDKLSAQELFKFMGWKGYENEQS